MVALPSSADGGSFTFVAVIAIEGRFIVPYPDLSGIFSLPQMLILRDNADKMRLAILPMRHVSRTNERFSGEKGIGDIETATINRAWHDKSALYGICSKAGNFLPRVPRHVGTRRAPGTMLKKR